MVEVSVTGDAAIFEIQGLHRLWALRSRVEVPLRQITSVHADPMVNIGRSRSLRFPGTHIPGRIKAGTYYERGRRVFWDVVRPEQAIVVELSGNRFDELVVEVRDPRGAVEQLRSAIPRPAS
jgi:hypothetical protein